MKKILLLLFLFFCLKSKAQLLQISTATSGTVTAINTQQDVVLVHDAGATITITIAFPANPKDGQMFSVSTVGGMTSVTLSAVIGAIQNTVTTMAAGGSATYMYSGVNTKWYKIR